MTSPSFESDMSRCPCGDKPKNRMFKPDGTLREGWRQVSKDTWKRSVRKDCCPCGLRVWSKRQEQYEMRRNSMHLMSGKSREVWEWWFERQGYAQSHLRPQGPAAWWESMRASGYDRR